MGNRGDVYERYYMPNFVNKDCLAIYLGTTRRDDLVQAVGRLERHSRAPDDLNDVQKAEIRNHLDAWIGTLRRSSNAATRPSRLLRARSCSRDTMRRSVSSTASGQADQGEA
jgi:hypothetical protein